MEKAIHNLEILWGRHTGDCGVSQDWKAGHCWIASDGLGHTMGSMEWSGLLGLWVQVRVRVRAMQVGSCGIM